MNINGAHGRVAKRNPLLSKENIAVHLRFAQSHVDTPEDCWKNILWTNETEIKLFGLNEKHYVWRRANTAFQHKNHVPSVKHGGDSIMVWACFAAPEPGRLAIIDRTEFSVLPAHSTARCQGIRL